MLDRNSLYSAYFTRDKLVHHHINSFNDFIDKGLQKVIDEVNIIETNIENTYVKLGNIRVEKPMVREADGSVEKLPPLPVPVRESPVLLHRGFDPTP